MCGGTPLRTKTARHKRVKNPTGAFSSRQKSNAALSATAVARLKSQTSSPFSISDATIRH